MGNTANTLTLARLILRLDRFRIALWLGGLTFFTLIVPVAFQNLYGTQQERDALALTMENPAMTAMVGPGDLENYTMGTMTAHQMILMTAVVAGLMAVLLTSRWTRGEEEEGRVEMIRSLPAGRLAHLMAAILVMILVSVLLAVFTGFGLAVMGEASMTLEGSLLYGTILGGVSLFFGGVTAVAAQLLSNPRGTVGFSIAVLLGSYLFRAVTDISNETLSWVSPLGWVTKAEVYSGNHWGPAVMLVLSAGVLFAAGSWLNSIRDLGRSFVPPRKGRERASRLLQSPLGLTLRLQRTGFIVWAAGVFILGASYGSVLGDMEAFF
ncbi:MAG: ABC transporter permease, partial [Alkalicoccus sp.]